MFVVVGVQVAAQEAGEGYSVVNVGVLQVATAYTKCAQRNIFTPTRCLTSYDATLLFKIRPKMLKCRVSAAGSQRSGNITVPSAIFVVHHHTNV